MPTGSSTPTKMGHLAFRAAWPRDHQGAGVGGTEMMSVAEERPFEVLLDNTSLSSSSTHPYASTGTRDFAIYLGLLTCGTG